MKRFVDKADWCRVFWLAVLAVPWRPTGPDAANAQEKPVRIASDVSGHIHPAICVTPKGTVVVLFCQSDYKDLRQTTSTDGGKTWSKPAPYELTAKQSIYPGSLTTLKDGRILHAWN